MGVALLALFLALGAGALAATSFIGSDGKIRGCVSKTGQLTVLKPGKKCAKGTTAIAWNQKGPAGQSGQQGAKGDQGLKGDACLSSDPNCKGPKGDTGPAGSAIAYASINPSAALNNTDTIDDSRSKGLTDADVTHPADGVWCINNITVKNAVASSAIGDGTVAIQGLNSDATPCPGDEAVQLRNRLSGVDSNTAFVVAIN
jgi:hypothetical protein